MAAGLVLVLPAAASHPEVSLSGSNFEIDTDANLKVDDPTPSIDWANVSEVRKQDTASGPTDESFGQGAKEDTAVPSVVDGSIPPNKSDLKFFGVYQEGTSGSGFLNLFWSRVQDPSGTTNMDFEFNKRQCTPNQTPADADCTANGLTPIRSVGDLLVIYDLSQGGTHPTLSIREWGGSSWGAPTDLTASNKATGSINTSAIPAAESDGLGGQSARTFGEAQVALSAIFDPNTCESFGSAYLKSRSSDSFTAALKDFVPPQAVNITNCGSINIHKQDDSTPANPLAGATFTLYKDNAPLGPPDGAGPNQDSHGAEDTVTSFTCTTSAGPTPPVGDCSMTSVTFGSYWVVETATPPGHTTAADQYVTLSSGNATVNLTFTNARNPATVKVKKVDDDDPANPLAGATFTLFKDNGATTATTGPPDGAGPHQDSHGAEDTATAYTCTTGSGPTPPAGVCTITGIVDPGSYWVVETTTPTGHDPAPDQYVTVALGQDYDLTGTPFVNQRKFKVIVIVCQESTGSGAALYPSAVTIDGTSAGNSISSAQATAYANGLTDANLCGITQASKSGLHQGNHKADPINIPQ
jgi:hypothetical protein